MSTSNFPTRAQVTKYVRQGGIRCPFCGSDDISGGSFEADAGVVWQEIICQECQAEWQDVYRLSYVIVEDQPGKSGRNVRDVLPEMGVALHDDTAGLVKEVINHLYGQFECNHETVHRDDDLPCGKSLQDAIHELHYLLA